MLTIEGALAALLQMVGMQERDAAVVDAASRSSGQLIAETRNQLKLLLSTSLPVVGSRLTRRNNSRFMTSGQKSPLCLVPCKMA